MRCGRLLLHSKLADHSLLAKTSEFEGSPGCRACIPCHDYADQSVQVLSSDQDDSQTGKASAQDGQLKAASMVQAGVVHADRS